MKKLISIFCLILIAPPSIGEQGRLNFILIIMDDLRAQGLSIYGEKAMITPNIDELSAEGVVFDYAIANFPACGASRASIFTGLRPTRDRFTFAGTRIDEDTPSVKTLPEYLKDHGYHTASIGKVFHSVNDSDQAWSSPRVDFRVGQKHPKNYLMAENIEAQMNCEAKGTCVGKSKKSGAAPAFEVGLVEDDAYFDGRVAQTAISALEAFKKNPAKPFFLSVGFYKPHLPFNAPEKYWKMYNRDSIVMSAAPDKPKHAPRNPWHGSGELRKFSGIPQAANLWVQNVPRNLTRTLTHGYYAATTYVDAQLGRIIDKLKSLSLAENTMVILISDHGYNLADHTLWNKHTLFNVAIQSPLIVRGPSTAIGTRVMGPVEYIDIFPSLLEMAGIKNPRHLEGKSFTQNLSDPTLPTKKFVHARYKAGESISDQRFSYTAWLDEKYRITAHMLYDRRVDPLETVNLADDEDYSPLVTKLREELLSHVKQREERAQDFL